MTDGSHHLHPNIKRAEETTLRIWYDVFFTLGIFFLVTNNAFRLLPQHVTDGRTRKKSWRDVFLALGY
jgi:hypothetical protein